MKTTPRYAHTQKGVLRPILLALAAICFGIAFFMRDMSPYMIIFVAAAIACIVLSFTHVRLSVRDEGDCLSVRFGPIPLFKKSIPYAEITNVEKDRSHFLSGWGIHLTRKGWLWNIGGYDCVRIEMGIKCMLIGTDDPDGLVAFLSSKVTKTANKTPSFGNVLVSWAKYASAIGAVIALVFGIWWFTEIGGHCGVVRFYENILGGLLIGGWLAGTALGLTIASIARRKCAKAFVVIGCVIAMLANVGLVIVSAKIAYDFLRRI